MELEKQTTEQLALLIGQQYQIILQCYQNIWAINNEINSRMKKKENIDDGKRD